MGFEEAYKRVSEVQRIQLEKIEKLCESASVHEEILAKEILEIIDGLDEAEN